MLIFVCSLCLSFAFECPQFIFVTVEQCLFFHGDHGYGGVFLSFVFCKFMVVDVCVCV